MSVPRAMVGAVRTPPRRHERNRSPSSSPLRPDAGLLQFFLLAPYVAFEGVHKLVTGERPETSWLGIALVTSSVIGMPFLGIAKRRLADKLGSVATRGEGTQNLLCA
jgi:hypothetical protein